MATVTMQGAFDFANAPSWTVLTVFGTPTVLNISDALKSQTFYGSFAYSGTTANPQVRGSVDRIMLTVGNSAIYEITGLNLDAARLQQLVLTPNGAQQFNAYVLAGNDRFMAFASGSTLLGYGGNDTMGGVLTGTFNGGAGIDTFEAAVTAGVVADLGAGRVTEADPLVGDVLRLVSVENLIGSNENDTLAGSAGANRLDGRAGIDTVSYASATTAVQVDLAAGTGRGAGNDTLLGIENAVGGRGADLLSGSMVANRFDGGAGADTMRGGLGNDSYVIDQRGDVIVEAAGAGTDTVYSPFSLVLAATLENLVLTGTAALSGVGNLAANRLSGNLADNWLRGLDGADTLNGGAGNDTLDGGSGADSLSGGLGDDFYFIDNTRDLIGDERGGSDAVASTVSFALGSLEIERLRLDGTAAINGTGNWLANVLLGNVAANVLDGGAGADTLLGGAGDDVYLLDQAGDRVVERPGEGTDRVRSSFNYTLGAEVENLDLLGFASVGTGNGLANRINGNAVENLLDGGAGADTLAGGAGNDRYVVDNAGDVISERGGGQDLVQSAVDWVLGTNLDDLTLVGNAVAGTGNGAANNIRGNDRANRLDGQGGADTLIGGLGNDTYVVDAAGDLLLEYAGEGIDTVVSSISWTLELHYHIERLQLTGTAAIDGTGNWLENRLIGNAAANRLDGGSGADTMAGGAGDDHYVVEHPNDVVVEQAGGGYDTIETTWSSLVLANHVEKGVLRDGAFMPTLTGNALANLLIGSSAADTLDGAAGADTLRGGAGGDTYFVDDALDRVIDDGVGGMDLLLSTVDILAPTAGVEVHRLAGSADLRVSGSAGNDDLGGNDGANQLDGGSAGADTLRGGAGDDTYLVDHETTLIDEAAGGGDDLVRSSVSLTTYSEIERITLTGSADIDVTCFNAGVVLTGNAGSNQLVGAYGQATVSYANATGAVAVDLQAGSASGFGNDVLVGMRAVIGSGFDDTIRGSADDDRLSGGAGADRFVLWNTTADSVRDFQAGSDVLAIDQSDLAIGNGDLAIDGATSLSAPGGFAPQAELVLGAVTAGSAALAEAAAAAIVSANAAYAAGQSALFTLQGSDGVGIYRFVAANADALVEAGELQLLAILEGTAAVSSADFAWID